MSLDLIRTLDADHADYLHDESRLSGTAESIAFPCSEEDVGRVLHAVSGTGGTITIQGARTGVAGGAVPKGGCILNLSRLNRMNLSWLDKGRLIVQPGVLLSDIRTAVGAKGLFFPPDPTETTASIGGMIATNASGARSFAYGPIRKWVEALRVVQADGSILALRRCARYASGRKFSVVTEQGREIAGQLPTHTMPLVKNAAGYFVADNVDLIDLFIGMEGTLGIVTEAELRLIQPPAAVCALTVFLPSLDAALSLVRLVRGETVNGRTGLSARPVAIEFFNDDTLNLLRQVKAEGRGSVDIPDLPARFHTAVYLEYHGAAGEALEAAAVAAMEAAAVVGGRDEDTWYAATPRDMERHKAFRHAVPESVNARIGELRKTDPSLAKLGTDMSVPDAALEGVMAMYRGDLASAGLASVIFGHIGDNHLHVNILARTGDEYRQGRALYQSWARRVAAMGGSVSAEHGIGRLKGALLAHMVGEEGMAQMLDLKRLFDPGMMLNPGVIFN